MRAGYLGLTLDRHGLHVEGGVQAWKITRPGARWGLTLGLVWGPLRRPLARDGRNPWKTPPDAVVRLPWAVLPWFHAWHWWGLRAGRHPARVYLGGKVFHVRAGIAGDPAVHAWARPEERGDWYMTPSASLRRSGEGP